MKRISTSLDHLNTGAATVDWGDGQTSTIPFGYVSGGGGGTPGPTGPQGPAGADGASDSVVAGYIASSSLTQTNGDARWVKLSGLNALGDARWQRDVEILAPKAYGIVGDGSANDTTAFQSFVTAAQGKTVQASGTYLVTASITGLHGVRWRGTGKVVRGTDTFYLNPTGSQKSVLYVSTTGSDSNDGITAALPKATFQSAFDTIASYGPMLSGLWEVVAAAGTYPYVGVQQTLNVASLSRVVVRGPDVGGSPNVPTAILDGAGGPAYGHGLSATGSGTLVEFRDLKFTNFTTGSGDTTRIGCLGEGQSNMLTTNVHADTCSWVGIYAFSTQRAYIYGGILNNCRSGVSVNATEATVSGTGTKTVKITNSTEAAVYWSRGSQGHLDNAVIEDNPVGVSIDSNSRVHMVADSFKRNSYAIRTRSGGVWFDGGTNVYGTGVDANPTIWDNAAYSGRQDEIENAQSYARFGVDRTTRTLTGTTALTVMSTPYTLEANRMLGTGKSVRLLVHGILATTSTGAAATANFGGLSVGIPINASSNVAFEFDATLHEVSGGGFRAFAKITYGTNTVRMAYSTSGFVVGVANAVSFAGTLGATTDTINVYRTECYVIG